MATRKLYQYGAGVVFLAWSLGTPLRAATAGLSLMPVGVEKNIDQQAMADLIFWLKNWRYLDGKVPATSILTK